jgi:hypothetical protein
MDRKIDKKRTIQIVVDRYWGKVLKREATEREMSIKALTEQILDDYLGPIGEVAQADILRSSKKGTPPLA